MGFVFELDEQRSWNPSYNVGWVYVEQLRTLERLFGLRSGVEYTAKETLRLDLPVLQRFVDWVLRVLPTIEERALLVLVAGCCQVTIALLDKAAGQTTKAPPGYEWLVEAARNLQV